MNKLQYGISLAILISLGTFLFVLGTITSQFMIFGLSAFIIIIIGFFILEKQKDWVVRDERTNMIDGKASHYTLIAFLILGFIASFILEFGGIDETSGQVLRMVILLTVIVRSIFWGHFNRKYA